MTNPYICREVRKVSSEGVEWKASPADKIRGFYDYLGACEKYGMVKLNDLRLKAVQFTKGIEFTKQTRVELQAAQSVEEIRRALEDFMLVVSENGERKINIPVSKHGHG